MDIGPYIRQHVLPQGMTVTDAAKQLGVGRPALSNLLNGRAALSPAMALRLEKAFGADRQDLLDRQARTDRDRSGEVRKSVAVQAHVPSFLTITARRINDWATSNDARAQLPVLLRRLIHSTGSGLRRVDFPGYDNAQRAGWDGWLEAGAATPWIPHGASGWELSTNHRPRDKAEHDYREPPADHFSGRTGRSAHSCSSQRATGRARMTGPRRRRHLVTGRPCVPLMPVTSSNGWRRQ